MRRLSLRQLGIAIAVAALTLIVLAAAAPVGSCREPGLYEECSTADHLVLLGVVLALVCLVVFVVAALLRLLTTRRDSTD
jgi:hypothetical protein